MSDDPIHGDPLNPEDVLPFDRDAADESVESKGPVPLDQFLYDGRAFTADEFAAFVQTYDFGPVPPDFIVLHHTAIPGLGAASVPGKGVWDAGEAGLSDAQIRQRRRARLDGIRETYRLTNQWDRGPHLFIDDRYIWVFTPMFHTGIHAKWGNQFNSGGKLHYSIGIEVVGYYEHTTWPEPVARLVGHAVAVLQRRLGTFDLRYMYPNAADKPGMVIVSGEQRCAHLERLRAGGISSHRDYNKPQCPGAAITEEFYMSVIRQAAERLARGDGGAPKYTEDSPLLAPPSASQEQMLAYILAHPHGNYSDDDIRTVIVPSYFAVCTSVGIDPALAIAQMIHETGNLTSFWSARPQRNPGGIGVNGRNQAQQPADTTGWAFNTQRQAWEMGKSFATWKDDAIPAHVGRLLAYALPKGAENPAQRALIERAMAYRPLPDKLRGTAPTLKPLGKAHNPAGDGWASPGADYGARIAALAQKIVG
jgi:hypothetical protein